jgi:hypothetical protein
VRTRPERPQDSRRISASRYSLVAPTFQVSPSPPGAVVHATGGEPRRTPEATASPAQAYDDAVGDDGHGDRARTAQREDLVECSDNAQVPLLFGQAAAYAHQRRLTTGSARDR